MLYSHRKAQHLMTFNMHMENQTYKEPKIPKITPIKDLEGRDGQAVTDHVICVLVIHVLYCVSVSASLKRVRCCIGD